MTRTPFFARFLAPQVRSDIKAGGTYVTLKYPSDKDEFMTMKYPSDDDENVTLKYPSDGDDGGLDI